jgi:hypothetical protein
MESHMESRKELEKRISDLESQMGAMRATGVPVGLFRGIRKRAAWGIGDIPFYDVAIGPDFARGQMRGHARGIFALGDMATGVVAVGGLARGVVAFGGLAVGLLSLGGLSVAVLAAVGGLAIGGLGFGGAALGGVAVGGGAVGYYACGGGAAGAYVLSPVRRDPEAVRFFREHGLGPACGAR